MAVSKPKLVDNQSDYANMNAVVAYPLMMDLRETVVRSAPQIKGHDCGTYGKNRDMP